MPRKAIDYTNTIIYKIVCNDLNIKDLYVGNTTNFNQRQTEHKRSCCNEAHKSYNYPVYQFIRLTGGWNNWSMIEVEKISCQDGNEARKRERYWFEELKANLNRLTPLRTEEERVKNCKKYNAEHKDEITQQRAEYYEKNKEAILQQCKEYHQKNKDEIKIGRALYREQNREKIRLSDAKRREEKRKAEQTI